MRGQARKINANLLIYLLCLGLILAACQQDPKSTEADQTEEVTAPKPYKLIVLGSDFSIGAGEDPLQAYPARLQQRFDSSEQSIQVVNASIKGETIIGAKERIYWLLQQRFDGILLELGQEEALTDSTAQLGLTTLNKLNTTIKENKPDAQVFFLNLKPKTSQSQEWASRLELILKAQEMVFLDASSLKFEDSNIAQQQQAVADWLFQQLQQQL